MHGLGYRLAQCSYIYITLETPTSSLLCDVGASRHSLQIMLGGPCHYCLTYLSCCDTGLSGLWTDVRKI